ncbi:MAG: DPP IV N-terminal domain-containing protein [Planctomycetes bacterium]|nr:DPP IV N-terminal domain-containing protein [Planctomycetota bacterium]
MHRLLAITAFAAPVLAQDVAVRGRQLELIDMFRLDYFAVVGAEDPVAWIDAAHYSVFDGGENADPRSPEKAWWAVAARTGEREPLVARAEVGKALSTAGLAAEAVAAIDHQDAWTWSEDHARYVVNAGNDLWGGARGAAPVRLTETPDSEEVGVRLSPDGANVAFIAGYDLHVVPSAGGEVRALTTGGNDDLFYGRLDWVYQEELYGRGNFQGYWWSPDGKRIALLKLDEAPVQEFVLVRSTPARPEIERTNYPKAGEPNPIVDVGVIDVDSGDTRWFDLAEYPSEDRLAVRVTWAPDGAEVFFQIQNREQTWLDMLAGDAATGAVRKVFHEASDCWVEAEPEPVFVADGREFFWLSERDGRKHLYHYRRDGALLGQVTKGPFQVQEIAGVDAERHVVYVRSDRADRLQSDLFAIGADGEMRRVTAGSGSWEIELAPDARTFVGRHSDVLSPPSTTLLAVDGEELRAIAPSRVQILAPYGLSEPEFVTVPARDGFEMAGYLIKPPGFDPARKYPALHYNYSGPHAPRVRRTWGSRDLLWHELLAQHGYVVFCCDNRSASGFGREFAKACWRKPGQSELRDLEDGRDWLVEQGFVDPERIAIWGWSYGGYQTLYNLTHSAKWRAGVAVNPATDWRLYDTIYTERYFGLPTTNARGYAAGSVVEAAGKLRGDLLLIAATMDDNVHVQNTFQFLHAMQEAGKDCDLMLYPDVRHGIEDLGQQLHLFGKFRRFLDDKIGPGVPSGGR